MRADLLPPRLYHPGSGDEGLRELLLIIPTKTLGSRSQSFGILSSLLRTWLQVWRARSHVLNNTKGECVRYQLECVADGMTNLDYGWVCEDSAK